MMQGVPTLELAFVYHIIGTLLVDAVPGLLACFLYVSPHK